MSVTEPLCSERAFGTSRRWFSRDQVVSQLLWLMGGLPVVVCGFLSETRSEYALCVFGLVPWAFAAAASFTLRSDSRQLLAWNVLMASVLTIDLWYAVWSAMSRQLYYSLMLRATPFLNATLLVPGFLLVILTPVVARRFTAARHLAPSALARRNSFPNRT